jgi:hypothetical protein
MKVQASIAMRTWAMFLVCTQVVACASTVDDNEVDDETTVASAEDALCKTGRTRKNGTFGGLPIFSNGCQSWQVRCSGSTEYRRAIYLYIDYERGLAYSKAREWVVSGSCR